LRQQRYASIHSSLSDTKGAYNKRIRRGRGPSSGKGKTSGRGHKGQKQHGKVPAGFNGGQTPDEVVRGDRVAASSARAEVCAEVVCVVKTRCFQGKASLVTLPGGLRLTPYHPIHKEDGWYFPLDLATPERDAPCDAVYNFVLAGERHAMVINGVECVTLAHGISAAEGGAVVAHAYFGTQRVVDDLRRLRGWDAGRVELFPELCAEGRTMVRDAKTGMVCGFAAGVDGAAALRAP